MDARLGSLAARLGIARQAVAFALIGGALTALGSSLVYALLLAGWRYDAANATAWAASVLLGFVAHRGVTFQLKGPATLAEGACFLLTAFLRLALSTAGLGLLLDGLNVPPGPAVLLTTAAVSLLSFVAMRRFVFLQPAVPAPAIHSGVQRP
jgi:putative flippase GtrA